MAAPIASATPVSGMWMPERVWEQSLTSDLAEAGIQYTVLDDFHFKNAGLSEDELHGYYITEDDGQAALGLPRQRAAAVHDSVSPSRRRRSTTCAGIAEQQPGAVVVFGDDGEKFGIWPGTKEHVYDHGWLRRFFDALVDNRSWLKLVTPTEALDQVPPLGKVYIPEGSYREMTEWALPTDRLKEFEDLRHDLEHEGRWHGVRAVRPRRLLAKLQSEVSRNQRNVRPHADGQPPAARRWSAAGAERATSSIRPAPSSTAANATAATGTARSAAPTCRTCAMRSTNT